MQIYLERLTGNIDLSSDWTMYIDPVITIGKREIRFNDDEYRYKEIARISIDGNTKIFKEAFIWARNEDGELLSEQEEELVTDEVLSISARNFMIETFAPKCLNSFSKALEKIPDVDLKKYAKAMTLHQAFDKKR